MKTSHVSDDPGLSTRVTDQTTSAVPPTVDDVPPRLSPPTRRRRSIILLAALGALIVAIPLAIWALVGAGGGDNTPVATPSTATVPAAPPQVTGGPVPPSQAPPSQVPSTGAPGQPAGLPRHYTAVRLPALSDSTEHGTGGFALNDRGQVVGQSDTSNGRPHPVLWQNGKVIDLGVLPFGAEDELGIARDINNRGDVVGGSNGANGQRAVLWRNGKIIDLGTLNGNPTFAYAINDNGQIVGTSTTATGELRGFLWENGRMRDLGIDGGVIPRDINNKGQVVGSLDFGDNGGRQRAFLWENGVVTRLQAPGILSSAHAINDKGEIVGGYLIDVEVGAHPVRWYQGSMTELGLLPKGNAGGAAAINDSGQIVGTSNVQPNSAAERGFLWWRGAMHDLTRAGVPEAYGPVDINNRGQILAGDMLFNPE